MKKQTKCTKQATLCGTSVKNFFTELRLLINSVPNVILSLFVIAVFCMNLMANKSVLLPFDWLALDCGFVVSWFVFLVLDVMTMHFGPKAATFLSVFATLLNFVICIVFFIVSIIPGVWGASFVQASQDIINTALDKTFGGTWYVIFGSAVAFLLSSAVNNFTNHLIGKIFKKNPHGIPAYLSRCYISTALAQFADNMIFSLLVSRTFFGWSFTQCITCSLFGMAAELIFEGIFWLFGYKICDNWRKNNIGKEYLCYVNSESQK